METKSVFAVLNAMDCKEHIEKKNGLSYLSWAWAWAIAKGNFPDANYTIYENSEGWNYFTDGRTCWVKTGVTIQGQEHIEELPVMDFRNSSIPYDKVTSFDVNKAIQRSLTKALARHGLGLYIYAGEDLPEDAPKVDNPFEPEPKTKKLTRKVDPASYGAKNTAPVYTPMDEGRYRQLIARYAEGQTSKSGRSLRDVWAEMTHADETAQAQFDKDIQAYYASNGR